MRSSNTGITSIISSKGKITEQIPTDEQTVLIGNIGLSTKKSVYVLIGDIIVLPSICLWIYIMFYKRKKKDY